MKEGIDPYYGLQRVSKELKPPDGVLMFQTECGDQFFWITQDQVNDAVGLERRSLVRRFVLSFGHLVPSLAIQLLTFTWAPEPTWAGEHRFLIWAALDLFFLFLGVWRWRSLGEK